MPFRDDRDHIDREILDIIPERFDADPDSHYARKTALIRTILTISLVVLAVAALGAATRYIFFPAKPKMQAESGVPLITADEKPIKTKPGPEERGGMAVPNRDKLVYEKMGSSQESEPQSERLLPPPEAPAAPPVQPRSPSIKPAFQTPPAKEINTANLPPEPPKPAKPVPGNTVTQAMPAAPAPLAPAPLAPAPVAPVAKAAPAAPAAKAAAAAPIVLHPPGGGAWHVQLGSLKSEADGKAEWTHIHSTNKDVLGSYSGEVVRTDLGAKGVYWRIYAGPMDEAKARTVCAQLAKRNQGCIIGKE